MEKQIEDTMKKAFYDLIDENTCCTTPDFDWIVSLYVEIKMSLMHFLKKGSLVHKQIDESFDVELFSQMIRADVFSADSMVKLIENTFFWIKELGAPARDQEVDEAKKRILQSPVDKIISIYLKETHDCISVYQQDMVIYLQK